MAEFMRRPVDLHKPRFRRGQGCDTCSGTGYHGRTGIYELMPVSDDVRALIVRGAPLAELRAQAEQEGLVSLRAAGWAQAAAGITTIDEVLRVTRDDMT